MAFHLGNAFEDQRLNKKELFVEYCACSLFLIKNSFGFQDRMGGEATFL